MSDATGAAVEYLRELTLDRERLKREVQELQSRLDKALEDVAEHDASFELRWDADMRAIKRWQAAGEGRELRWPDHADLCVWLLGQIDEAASLVRRMSDERKPLHDQLMIDHAQITTLVKLLRGALGRCHSDDPLRAEIEEALKQELWQSPAVVEKQRRFVEGDRHVFIPCPYCGTTDPENHRPPCQARELIG